MKGFCPLASGSKGNCLYLSSGQTKLLIDAGISYKTLQERLEQIGVSVREIDAILVTHEHMDHIRGLEKLAKELAVPILANGETAKAILKIFKHLSRFKIFSTGESFEFGDVHITPFSVPHDTLDPVAFTFQLLNAKIGVCTDLGFVTALVRSFLRACDYLYLEANHEPSMVHTAQRPMAYKLRVLGKLGHISNDECAALVHELAHESSPTRLKHVYLAHLSEECNHPELALKKVGRFLSGEVGLSIAYQEKVSHKVILS